MAISHTCIVYIKFNVSHSEHFPFVKWKHPFFDKIIFFKLYFHKHFLLLTLWWNLIVSVYQIIIFVKQISKENICVTHLVTTSLPIINHQHFKVLTVWVLADFFLFKRHLFCPPPAVCLPGSHTRKPDFHLHADQNFKTSFTKISHLPYYFLFKCFISHRNLKSHKFTEISDFYGESIKWYFINSRTDLCEYIGPGSSDKPHISIPYRGK